jgi:hypothetical protein
MTEPSRILYLAVPTDIFNSFFQERFTQAVIVKQLKFPSKGYRVHTTTEICKSHQLPLPSPHLAKGN